LNSVVLRLPLILSPLEVTPDAVGSSERDWINAGDDTEEAYSICKDSWKVCCVI
jgi:hypothetical protein